MIIGHQAQLNFLKKSLEMGKLAHAYLFIGPNDIGKKKVAEEFISWILGKKIEVKEGQSWEIKFVKRSYDQRTGKKHKDISIEQIHEIRDYLSHGSFINSKKVVLIDEAEFLSRGASNALLKTLEEPRATDSLTILLAESEDLMLPTVVSRCQLIRFYPVPIKEIYEALVKKGASRDLALEISRLANHKPELALELFENQEELAFYRQETERFFKVQKGSLFERFQIINNWFGDKLEHADHIEARDNLIKILKLWQILWRDFYLCQNQTEELVSAVEEIEKSRQQAKRYNLQQIGKVVAEINEAIKLLRQNVHPRLIIENLILSFY